METHEVVPFLRITTTDVASDSTRVALRTNCHHGTPESDNGSIPTQGGTIDSALGCSYYTLIHHSDHDIRAVIHLEDLDGEEHGGFHESQDVAIEPAMFVPLWCSHDNAIAMARQIRSMSPEQIMVVYVRRKVTGLRQGVDQSVQTGLNAIAPGRANSDVCIDDVGGHGDLR